MYFPALKKLKRIVSESPNSPKTGSVFGTEIAYEDNERLQLDDYEFAYLGDEVYDGVRCQVLEATPTAERRPRTAYGRQRIWIAPDSMAPLKRELFDKRSGKLVKTLFLKRVEQHGPSWIARMQIVVNHESRRMTLVRVDRLAVDVALDVSLFSERALEDASYREGKLRALRDLAK